MNRINQLFNEKQQNILSMYFTAGCPDVNTTFQIIETLEKNGVDMIEIGMPFSDPLADGPTIQQSSQKALENGMSLATLFTELSEIRHKVQLPLLLMGYLNTVLQYGIEKFLTKLKVIGIDGVILPDMPIEIYETEYQHLFEKHEIIPIFLITPETPDERIQKIDDLSKGFIYMVSSSSTTGAKNSFDAKSLAYFDRIKTLNLKTPIIGGFGISNSKTFNQVCKYAKGGIIGSAFVKAIESKDNLLSKIENFVYEFKK